MLALGIDPGTAICGYGVVEMKGSVMKPVFYGSILTDKDWLPEERLLKIHQDVSDIIGHFQPEFMSIEKLYFNRNVNTATDADKKIGHRDRRGGKEPDYLYGAATVGDS